MIKKFAHIMCTKKKTIEHIIYECTHRSFAWSGNNIPPSVADNVSLVRTNTKFPSGVMGPRIFLPSSVHCCPSTVPVAASDNDEEDCCITAGRLLVVWWVELDENADDDVITAIAVHTAAYLDDSIFLSLLQCWCDVISIYNLLQNVSKTQAIANVNDISNQWSAYKLSCYQI